MDYEGRFRQHVRPKAPENYKETGIFLEDILCRITQQDVVWRRIFDPSHRSYISPYGVYSYYEHADGTMKPFLMSRQMVIFCVERRKNWRILQSRAGIQNLDYLAQRNLLAKHDKGEITTEDLKKKTRELFEAEKVALQPKR